MPATVNISFLVKVDQINKKVVAHTADKTPRMPALFFSCT
jgi:hypothetical protein